jgi:hypothetical protein
VLFKKPVDPNKLREKLLEAVEAAKRRYTSSRRGRASATETAARTSWLSPGARPSAR